MIHKYLIMETIINKPNVVKLMRKIRKQFSSDIIKLSFEEQKKHIKIRSKKRKESNKKTYSFSTQTITFQKSQHKNINNYAIGIFVLKPCNSFSENLNNKYDSKLRHIEYSEII